MRHNAVLSFIVIVLLMSAIYVSGCEGKTSASQQPGNENRQSGEFSVIAVNNMEFAFNDTEAGGNITFTSPGLTQCSLTFIKSRFKAGYTTRITSLGEGDIDLTCLTDNDHYSMNNNGNTYAQITVSKEGDGAVVVLEFSLASVRSKTVLAKDNVRLMVSSDQLHTMQETTGHEK